MFGVWQKTLEVSEEDGNRIGDYYKAQCPSDTKGINIVSYFDDKVLEPASLNTLAPSLVLDRTEMLSETDKYVFSILICKKKTFIGIYTINEAYAKKYDFMFTAVDELFISFKNLPSHKHFTEEEMASVFESYDNFFTTICMALEAKAEAGKKI